MALRNGVPAKGGGGNITKYTTLTTGLTAHSEADGWVAGVTLENAAKLLLPHLRTWCEPTGEEMAAIRERMDENLAAIRERKSPDS